MKKSDPITLTDAEIRRRIAEATARRDVITAELQAIYAEAARSGFSSAMTLVSEDEQRARTIAKSLLAGTKLETPPIFPSVSRERELFVERRAIDLVLKVLNDERLKIRAADALRWHDEHGHEWRALCKQTTLAAVRLAAIERRTAELLYHVDVEYTPPLPMGNLIGRGAAADVPVGDLVKAALAEGIVTHNELKKAEEL